MDKVSDHHPVYIVINCEHNGVTSPAKVSVLGKRRSSARADSAAPGSGKRVKLFDEDTD